MSLAGEQQKCIACGDAFVPVKPAQGPTSRSCHRCRGQRWSARRRGKRTTPRPKTFTVNVTAAQRRAMSFASLIATRDLAGAERPRKRGDCLAGGRNEQRPCAWASCKWHLAIDVSSAGSLKVNHPDLEIDEMTATCALDVADRGGATLDEVGGLLNVARERIRQIEETGLIKLQRAAARFGAHTAATPAAGGSR